MKFLSDNFMVLFLAVVIGVSPLQSVAASASKCMDMNKNMHTQINLSGSTASAEMKHSGSTTTEDCCNKNECGTTHCAGATIVAIISNNASDVTYTPDSIYRNPNVILLPVYPSSLYRPPKV